MNMNQKQINKLLLEAAEKLHQAGGAASSVMHGRIRSALASIDEQPAEAVEPKVCKRCDGQGWLPIYHDDTKPCPACQPTVGD